MQLNYPNHHLFPPLSCLSVKKKKKEFVEANFGFGAELRDGRECGRMASQGAERGTAKF